MIILYFHLQPQYKYELFHIYYTSKKISKNKIDNYL